MTPGFRSQITGRAYSKTNGGTVGTSPPPKPVDTRFGLESQFPLTNANEGTGGGISS